MINYIFKLLELFGFIYVYKKIMDLNSDECNFKKESITVLAIWIVHETLAFIIHVINDTDKLN